jgi:hypothetical protein
MELLTGISWDLSSNVKRILISSFFQQISYLLLAPLDLWSFIVFTVFDVYHILSQTTYT